jgi:hypothetical protein
MVRSGLLKTPPTTPVGPSRVSSQAPWRVLWAVEKGIERPPPPSTSPIRLVVSFDFGAIYKWSGHFCVPWVVNYTWLISIDDNSGLIQPLLPLGVSMIEWRAHWWEEHEYQVGVEGQSNSWLWLIHGHVPVCISEELWIMVAHTLEMNQCNWCVRKMWNEKASPTWRSFEHLGCVDAHYTWTTPLVQC